MEFIIYNSGKLDIITLKIGYIFHMNTINDIIVNNDTNLIKISFLPISFSWIFSSSNSYKNLWIDEK